MAIDLATGFNIGSKDAIDERQVLTLEQMKNLDESIYPDKYFAICKDNGKLYLYDVNNGINNDTGKFRKVSSNESVDPSIFQKINDDSLITEDKTIVGAINELKTGVSSISVPTQVSQLINDSGYITSDEVDLIKEYNPDETYNEGQICLYNNYVWLCKTVTTGTFEESDWEKQTDNITELDLDTIKTFLGLTPEQLETMADIILDTEVRLDKTYSSSKIYSDIQDAIDSSKSFTLAEIGKMSGASYKVVTSIAEMTDGKIIYLLENGTTYEMYIVETAGTVTKIGDTTIDLSSYLKVTDAESAYLKKTEASITYTTQTSFNNHITDTVAHLTQFEKNKLLTTDNITSTINNNSDNTQVPSAKATYNLANTKANTNHTHNTSDIKGLSIPTKVSDLENDRGYLTSIPEEYITETELTAKKYLTSVPSTYALKTDIPTVPTKTSQLTNDSNYQTAKQVNSAVTTEIAKVETKLKLINLGDNVDANNCRIEDRSINCVYGYCGLFTRNVPKKDYAEIRCYHYGSGIKQFIDYTSKFNTRTYTRFIQYDGNDSTDWQELATMDKLNHSTVEDVGVTTITPVNSNITGNIEYTVKNGICYVSFKNVNSTTNTNDLSISTTMPKSSINCGSPLIANGKNGNIGFIYIDKNTTKLNGNFWISGISGSCSFSYPVAE